MPCFKGYTVSWVTRAGTRDVEAYARASLRGELRLVDCLSERFCSQLEAHGSLRDGVIDPLEGAFQAARGRIIVDGSTGWPAALRVVEALIGDVDYFIVYYDLRRRGRRVRRGVRRRTLLVYYSPRRVAEVLVLSEGRRVTVESIIEWSRLASADGHEPVVAVVDSYGRATYYEARAARTIA